MRNINYIIKNNLQFKNKTVSQVAKALSSSEAKYGTKSGSVAEAVKRYPKFSEGSISESARFVLKRHKNAISLDELYDLMKVKMSRKYNLKRVLTQLMNYNFVQAKMINDTAHFLWNKKSA